jgi:tripartite-type tricarboxylate transporter receptor subunit TctC
LVTRAWREFFPAKFTLERSAEMKKRLAVRSIRMVLLLGAIGMLSHAAALTGYAAGAKYPAKPILFVVPYAPGGGTDIMVRVIDRVGTQLKVLPQPLVIENKSGGSGVVGKSYAKTATRSRARMTAAPWSICLATHPGLTMTSLTSPN